MGRAPRFSRQNAPEIKKDFQQDPAGKRSRTSGRHELSYARFAIAHGWGTGGSSRVNQYLLTSWNSGQGDNVQPLRAEERWTTPQDERSSPSCVWAAIGPCPAGSFFCKAT